MKIFFGFLFFGFFRISLMTALILCVFRSLCCHIGIIFILKIRFKGIFRRFETLLYLG